MRAIKLIHIGYPKCGSTFLQAEVFPKIRAVKTDSTTESGAFLLKAVPHIMTLDEIYYDPGFVKECSKKIPDEINVISYEGFAGFVSLGRGVCSNIIARRLHEVFPEAKILIVIRNQKTIIPSLYMHDVKIGIPCDFHKWLGLFRVTFRYVFLKYSKLIECYQKEFGKERVKVVFFEELFKEQTVESILDFAEIDDCGIREIDFNAKKNPAYTPLSLAMTRFLNSHFGTKMNFGAGFVYGFWRYRLAPYVDKISDIAGLRKKKLIDEEILSMLRAWYEEDNLHLSRLLERDIPEGYSFGRSPE